ncbi:MAG: hypothetical protein ACI8W8_000636 [Rhodothermales bacterium]|jgi:hypothetical protein
MVCWSCKPYREFLRDLNVALLAISDRVQVVAGANSELMVFEDGIPRVLPPGIALPKTPASPLHPLLRAIAAGDIAVLRQLLADGTDPNARDLAGVPLLARAAAAGEVEMLGLLLEAGATLGASDFEFHWQDTMYYAATADQAASVQALLEKDGAVKVGTVNAAARAGAVRALAVLCEHGHCDSDTFVDALVFAQPEVLRMLMATDIAQPTWNAETLSMFGEGAKPDQILASYAAFQDLLPDLPAPALSNAVAANDPVAFDRLVAFNTEITPWALGGQFARDGGLGDHPY